MIIAHVNLLKIKNHLYIFITLGKRGQSTFIDKGIVPMENTVQ